MTFVKAVTPELDDQLKNLVRLLLRQPAVLGPLDELGPAGVDDVRLLLAGRLDARVRVRRLPPPVLAVDVLVHHPALERAGAVQGRARDDVPDVVRLHPLEQLADALPL